MNVVIFNMLAQIRALFYSGVNCMLRVKELLFSLLSLMINITKYHIIKYVSLIVGLLLLSGIAFGEIVNSFDNISYPAIASKDVNLKDCYQTIDVPLNQVALQKIQYCKLNNIPFWLGIRDNSNDTNSWFSNSYFHMLSIPLYVNGRMVDAGNSGDFHLHKDTSFYPPDYTSRFLSSPTIGSREIWGGRDYPLQTLFGTENYRWFHSYDVNYRGRIKNAYVKVTITEHPHHLPPVGDNSSSFHFVVIPDDCENYNQIETGPSPIPLHWYGFWTYVPMQEYLYELLDFAGSSRGKYFATYASWDRSRTKAGDPVDLATGEETHTPQPDLVVYNPNGPEISLSRTYSSVLAKSDYSSPGLPKGWSHNFDYRIEEPAQDWGSLILCHPNGYSQEIFPEVDGNGNPANPANFEVEDGSPFVITGIPNTTTWDSIKMTGEDHVSMTFTKPSIDAEAYYLSTITDQYGNSVRFTGRTQSNNYAPVFIEDVKTGKNLLKFNYNANNYISEIIEYTDGKPFRKIGYRYDVSLLKVSKMISVNEQFDWVSPRWEYTYTLYDAKQLLTTISQPTPADNGKISTLTFSFDSEGKVISQKDSIGSKITFNYQDDTTVVKTLNSTNQQVSNFTQLFDIYGRNAGTIDMNNKRSAVNYENNIFADRPTSITNSNGQSVVTTYNNDGKPSTISGPYGNVTYTYDGVGPLSKLISIKKNGITQKAYTYTNDNSGLIKTVSTLRPGATTEALVTTTYTYDFEKYPSGPKYGRIVEVIEPASDTSGNRTLKRDYNYNVDYKYNSLGLAPGPYKPAVSSPYPLTVTDENNRMTHYRYDSRGNVIVYIDPDGRRSEMEYNIADQLILTIEPLDPVTQKQQVIYNKYAYIGGFIQYTINFPNISENSKYRNGDPGFKSIHKYENKYDSEGKLIKTLLDGSIQVEKVYDSIGRLIKIKDCRNATPIVTNFSFDSSGHLVEIDGPANQKIVNTDWDSIGRVITSTDSRGIRTTYNYDQAGKKELQSIDYYDTINNRAFPSVSYTYYPDGQVQTVTDNTGTRTYNYDLAGYTKSVATTYTDLTGNASATINYTYNQDGSLASNQIVTPSTTLDFSYTYDKDGRLINLKNPAGKQSSWEFNPDRTLKSQRMGNRAETWYYYDSFDRLSKQESKDPKGNLLTRYSGFTYNDPNFDGLTGYNINIWGKPAMNGNRSFAYDAKQRLQSESWTPQQEGTTASGSYSFDDQGNILTSPHEIAGYSGNDNHRHYNNNYQWDGYSLSTDQTNALIPASQSLFEYDENGNPTKYKNSNSILEYDAQDHMVSYKIGTGNPLMTAGYRSDGLRAWKQNAQGRTYYIYSGTTLLCELDATGDISSYHTWGPTGLLNRTVIAGNKETWYIFDPQGDVALRLNANSEKQSADRYDAFGNLLAGGDNTDPYGYKGQNGYYTDHETGLILCTYRYYDPLAAHWLTADPIGLAGGLNLYAYCSGDPVNAVDPLGLTDAGSTAIAVTSTALYGFTEPIPTTPEQFDEINMGGSVGALGDVCGRFDGSLMSYWCVGYRTAVVGYYTWQTIDGVRSRGLRKRTNKPSSMNSMNVTANESIDDVTKGMVHPNENIQNIDKIHGNSALSNKPQHLYEIYNVDTDDVVKTGISGGPINEGLSQRAETQVRRFNRNPDDPETYASRIIKDNIPNRREALDLEKQHALELFASDNTMNYHKQPHP